jgi:hypothetical protein
VGPVADGQNFEVYVNGVATGIICTLAAGGATDASDLVNDFALSPGDFVAVICQGGAGMLAGAIGVVCSFALI